MKVLIVSHACVVDANQRLFVWLEQCDDIELLLVAPRTWRTDLRGTLRFQRLAELQSPIRLLRPVFSGQGSLHFYPGAAQCVMGFQPDVIFIDEEPWSLCAL